MMMRTARSFLFSVAAVLAALTVSNTEAFAPSFSTRSLAFVTPTTTPTPSSSLVGTVDISISHSSSPTALCMACRTNAKKEKIKRNRENMRKFKKATGRKGTTRRKMMKKALASKARQSETEFIAKCFITVPASGADDDSSSSSSSNSNNRK